MAYLKVCWRDVADRKEALAEPGGVSLQHTLHANPNINFKFSEVHKLLQIILRRGEILISKYSQPRSGMISKAESR